MATTASRAAATAGEDTVARLYESYGRQLYRFCLARMRSREEAEDAVQSTFLRAHAALRKGVVPRFEAAWLYKIAHNVCTTRRETLGRRALLETLPGDDLFERAAGPERPGRDDARALAEAVAELPESQRRAILLREWQGLSYAEIAEELDLSVSAVETLIFRARRRLIGELELRGARPGRLLDLGAALAALRGLLARLGGEAPVKLASGAALVAVGGAGIGVGVAVSDSRPARAPTPARIVPVTAEIGSTRAAATRVASTTVPPAPARTAPAAPAAPRISTAAPLPAPAASPPAPPAPPAPSAPARPAATVAASAPAPPPPPASTAVPTATAAAPSLTSISAPTISTPTVSLPAVTVPPLAEPPAVTAPIETPSLPATVPEPPPLPVSTPAVPLP